MQDYVRLSLAFCTQDSYLKSRSSCYEYENYRRYNKGNRVSLIKSRPVNEVL
jgi:hypothetical protein